MIWCHTKYRVSQRAYLAPNDAMHSQGQPQFNVQCARCIRFPFMARLNWPKTIFTISMQIVNPYSPAIGACCGANGLFKSQLPWSSQYHRTTMGPHTMQLALEMLPNVINLN